jgi:hypothetical protein
LEVLLLFLVVAGFSLLVAWLRRKPAPQPHQAPTTPSAATAAETSAPAVAPSEPAPAPTAPDELDLDELDADALDVALATDPPAPPPLADRLDALERVIEPLGSTCNHPRELAQQAPFKEAVAVFEDVGIDLDTVVHYALGPDWGIACAALAALAKRDDGKDAVDQVLIQFNKLGPWAMYFALAYFVAIVPRPPVGAPSRPPPAPPMRCACASPGEPAALGTIRAS